MIIGLLYLSYEDTILAEPDDLISAVKNSVYTMDDYLDSRRSSNFTRFQYDPFTGEKIDWKKLKEELKRKDV